MKSIEKHICTTSANIRCMCEYVTNYYEKLFLLQRFGVYLIPP